jgi:chromosome segregation ATPase
MTLSNFALLGIIEAFCALLCILVVFIILYRKANGRIKRLRTQRAQLKETTVFLLEKVNETKSETYPDLLTERVEEVVLYFNRISPGEPLTLQNSTEPAARVAVLRNYFLQGEIKADGIANPTEKWNQLTNSLEPVIDCLSTASGSNLSEDLKEKWAELCDAAIVLWEEQSTESEDNFVVLMQLINSELGFEHLIIPDKKGNEYATESKSNETRGKVDGVMASLEDQKDLIANLISQRNSAESEVTIKMDELKRLERFMKESEVCITLLEDELNGLHAEMGGLTKKAKSAKKLQEKIDDFEEECTQMISCIESLEKQNDDLRAQTG